jgi:hypothetical protein
VHLFDRKYKHAWSLSLSRDLYKHRGRGAGHSRAKSGAEQSGAEHGGGDLRFVGNRAKTAGKALFAWQRKQGERSEGLEEVRLKFRKKD